MRRWLLTLLVLGLLLLRGAVAQDVDNAGSFGVTLVTKPDAPVQSYFHYTLAPGQSAGDALELHNSTSKTLTMRVYGTDGFNTADGALTGPLFGEANHGAGTWITVDSAQVEVKPGKTPRIGFHLTVPADTKPGDYFAFVFVHPTEDTAAPAKTSASPSSQASFMIKLSQRIGICVWVRVPGELTSGLKVDSVQKRIVKGNLFLGVHVSSTGNTFLKPKASWKLTSPGGDVLVDRPMHELGYLLPGESIDLQIPVQSDRPLVRGEYRLSMGVQYGDNKQPLQETWPIQLP
ncbi:MAG: hypothetical protein ACYCW6_16910 [Candidatus Xenobia bacterium]